MAIAKHWFCFHRTISVLVLKLVWGLVERSTYGQVSASWQRQPGFWRKCPGTWWNFMLPLILTRASGTLAAKQPQSINESTTIFDGRYELLLLICVALFFFFLIIICFKFSPFLSQFGSQLHPHFSNYPVLLALDSPHTPRPWRPQIGSGDPWETYAFFKPYALDWLPWFQAPEVLEMRRSKSSPAESSPLPRSDEPIMPLQCEPAKLSPWQKEDSKPRPSVRRTGEPDASLFWRQTYQRCTWPKSYIFGLIWL